MRKYLLDEIFTNFPHIDKLFTKEVEKMRISQSSF